MSTCPGAGAPLPDYASSLAGVARRIDSASERHFWRCTLVFLLVFTACAITLDFRMKMWNDEVVTLYVAQQGSPAGIVAATKDGMDATPPLYPIMVAAVLPVVRPDALAVRLLSTLGFAGMLLAVLAFCHRRLPATYAFVAALLLTLTTGFYATEGRCYGLVLGLAAGALFSWQSAGETKLRGVWLISLGACLAGATALHYYSIFLLVPLGLGELARWRAREKFSLGVVLAMLPALIVLALHYPLIAAGKKYLAHFWTPGIASWSRIPEFYLQFASIPAAVLVVGWIASSLSVASGERRSANSVLPVDEWTAVGALALSPVLVLAISRITTHAFLPRYTLWASIGIAIACAALLCWVARRSAAVGTWLVAILTLGFVGYEVFALRQEPTLRQGEAVRRQINAVPQGSEPIVVEYDHAFMELSYYASPELRERLYYLLDRNMELQQTGSDLDYSLMSARGRLTRLHIVELKDFLRSNPKFLLTTSDKDYLLEYLKTSGYCWTQIDPTMAPSLYQVEKPERAQPCGK